MIVTNITYWYVPPASSLSSVDIGSGGREGPVALIQFALD